MRAATAHSLGKPLSLIGSSLPRKHLLKCFPATGAQYFHAKRQQQTSKTEQVLFFSPANLPSTLLSSTWRCKNARSELNVCLLFSPSLSAMIKPSRRGFWSSFPPAHPMRNLSRRHCCAHLLAGRINRSVFIAAICETEHFSYLQTMQHNQCFGFSFRVAS